MSTQYVLGIDHGSGSCKTTCLDSNGNIISEASVSYPSYYKHARWVEQKPEEWIDAAIKGIREVIKEFSPKQKKEIKGISFTAPAHVGVLLGKDMNVLRDVIMWNDQRSGKEATKLKKEYGSLIYKQTNHYPTPTWTLPHLYWLKKHEPNVLKQVHKVLFEKDYVRYRFSGELGTDLIEAEGSMLFDIYEGKWSQELLDLVGLDASIFPSIYEATAQAGSLTKEMADILGLPSGIPIIMGTTDTAAEVYGSGATEEGDAVVKLATAGNFSLLSKERHTNQNLTSYSFPTNGLKYQNSGTNFAASSYRWFTETFFSDWLENPDIKNVYMELDREVEKIKVGSEGLLFQPYLNGERSPHWDPYLRASFFGMTARHNRFHFARSVLEGVGYSLKDASSELPGTPSKSVKILGGGGKSEVWSEILANILDVTIEVPKHKDAAFGACLIAATAVGWYSNLTEAVKVNQIVTTHIEPNIETVQLYKSLFSIYKDLHTQTKALSYRLNELEE
ncbi:xylulokinase [Sporosarcina ureae]|uniref:xylulokinase n=1 Tax=Sporosarcina ureae TaxID=1571 RepID=UPI0026EBCAFF|nr:FGGY family carbohydrate kinase [Sporosarcina ureae]